MWRAGIDLYSDLESAGWKARAGTALARGNVQWRFYADAMASFCGSGQGRIYVLRFGDEVAAASLVVIAGDTAYLLKTTHTKVAQRRSRYDPAPPLHPNPLCGRARRAPDRNLRIPE
jgi:hypothetical protein